MQDAVSGAFLTETVHSPFVDDTNQSLHQSGALTRFQRSRLLFCLLWVQHLPPRRRFCFCRVHVSPEGASRSYSEARTLLFGVSKALGKVF